MVLKILPFLCPTPCFSDLTFWDMATEPTLQQLITQSAQATADTTNRSNCIHQPTHLWLGLKRCLSLFLHFSMHPGELAPSQLHCNWQWRSPRVCLCSPGNQIPGDACTVDAYWTWRGTKSNKGESFCFPWQNTTGNDTWHQHPCTTRRTWGCCGQAWGGPPKSCYMHQNTNWPLQDDQWWTSRAQAVPTYCPCLSPWRNVPWQTYGQILQDTF